MTESDKNISQLLKSRLSKNEPLEEDEWKLIEIELYKKRFYKFNISYFNVYYASLLVCSFLFSLITGIKYFSTPDNKTSIVLNKNKIERKDTSVSKTVNEVYRQVETSSFKPINKNNSQKPIKKKDLLDDAESKKNDTPLNNIPAIDSSQITQDPKNLVESELLKNSNNKISDVSAKKTAPKVETKIIYVTKQDTIFKYDTLRVKKGKDKKIKK